MTPRVPSTKGGVGKSFKGTAAYLLHDAPAKSQDGTLEQQESADRVAWTETRNLATDDPELAWKVMAATAKDAHRLKEAHHEAQQAGLPEDQRTPFTGRTRGFNHVFHYSLSWHPDEAADLTREEQTKAAYASLRALGADHLQAMVIAHNDTEHPHVHIMVNRINPETGEMERPDQHSQAKLRDWASDYERSRGHIWCEKREERRMQREQGLPYEHDASPARQHRERQEAAFREMAENPQRAQAVRDVQRERDAALSLKGREMRQRHREEWSKLSRDHRFRKAEINDRSDADKSLAKREIGKDYAPKWQELQAEQKAEKKRFEEREDTLMGKAQNVRDAITHIWKTRGEDITHRNLMAQSFKILSNAGARKQELEKAQASAQRSLGTREKQDIAAAIRAVEQTRAASIDANLSLYRSERSQLELSQTADRAADKAAWSHRDQERKEAWLSFGASVRLETDYEAAAGRSIAKAKQQEEERRRLEDERQRRQLTRDQTGTAEPENRAAVEPFDQVKSEPPAPPTRAKDDFNRNQDRGRGRERSIDDD